jgi:hypothetical protein
VVVVEPYCTLITLPGKAKLRRQLAGDVAHLAVGSVLLPRERLSVDGGGQAGGAQACPERSRRMVGVQIACPGLPGGSQVSPGYTTPPWRMAILRLHSGLYELRVPSCRRR